MRGGLTAMRSRMAPVPPTDAEERASAAVHAIGAIVGAVAVAFLIAMAAATGSLLAVAACAVYGGAAVLTLLSSALYHSAPRGLPPAAARAEEGRRKRRSRSRWLAFDHCAIFAMIAGTYTPILLLAFPHPLGTALAAAQWGLAAAGIGLRVRLGRLHGAMIPLFLAMGWMGFLWGDTMFAALGEAGGSLLLAGGVAYTSGLVFYLWRALPFNHAIWHGFVLAGAGCHFCVMPLHVLPALGG